MVKIKKQKIRPHKKKKEDKPGAKRNFKGIFKIVLWTILVAGIGVGIVAFQYMFVDSDLFNVKGLDVRFYDEKNVLRKESLDGVEDKHVLGANIFLVDLNNLKERIEADHPELRDIVVRRMLPDRLIIQARQRLAVAQVYGDRPYSIDKDGVFLPYTNNPVEGDIPLISGIRVAGSRSSAVQKERIKKALFLIDALSVNKKLSKYRIKTVDIADMRNISFFLSAKDAEKVEIKIGDSEFIKRLDVLATIMEQLGQDIERVKYIDLRFEDPIVGPR
ncbi:MAG: cell division protein FtsQ/DivIB [Candidatus Omnitrophica bacterium]|nr:cell division protein FtsQ/DivIB [Candidatus Omnitrophota bacterium]